jgi:hypothetical protein
MSYDRLGDILIAYGIITRDQLHRLLTEQVKQHMRLGDLLVLKGILTQSAVSRLLQIQEGLRDKDNRRRVLALADLALISHNRKNVVSARDEIQAKADKISDEYPTIFRKQKG